MLCSLINFANVEKKVHKIRFLKKYASHNARGRDPYPFTYLPRFRQFTRHKSKLKSLQPIVKSNPYSNQEYKVSLNLKHLPVSE